MKLKMRSIRQCASSLTSSKLCQAHKHRQRPDLPSTQPKIPSNSHSPEHIVAVGRQRQYLWHQRRLGQRSTLGASQHHRSADVRQHEERMPVRLGVPMPSNVVQMPHANKQAIANRAHTQINTIDFSRCISAANIATAAAEARLCIKSWWCVCVSLFKHPSHRRCGGDMLLHTSHADVRQFAYDASAAVVVVVVVVDAAACYGIKFRPNDT